MKWTMPKTLAVAKCVTKQASDWVQFVILACFTGKGRQFCCTSVCLSFTIFICFSLCIFAFLFVCLALCVLLPILSWSTPPKHICSNYLFHFLFCFIVQYQYQHNLKNCVNVDGPVGRPGLGVVAGVPPRGVSARLLTKPHKPHRSQVVQSVLHILSIRDIGILLGWSVIIWGGSQLNEVCQSVC